MIIKWKSCLRVGISIFCVFLCKSYWGEVARLFSSVISAAFPLFLGCIIAYVLNILMEFYERLYFPKSSKKIVMSSRRCVCIVAAFLTLGLIIALVVGILVPQLTSCVKLIISAFPAAMDKVVEIIDKYDIFSDEMIARFAAVDWESKIAEIVNMVTTGIGNVMNLVLKTLLSVFSGLMTVFLAVIFAIYLLAQKETLRRQSSKLIKYYLHEKLHGKLMYVLGILNECFRKYIVGQCVEAVILALLCFAGMLLLNLPYAAMISVLMGFTALIPIAGAYIGAGVGAFMIVMVSPVKALIFLIFIVLLQQLEGNIIYPRVVGNSLGLPAIWVLAAVTVGGGIMGVVGMLFGVPVAATIYRLVQNDIHAKEKGAVKSRLKFLIHDEGNEEK